MYGEQAQGKEGVKAKLHADFFLMNNGYFFRLQAKLCFCSQKSIFRII